MLFWLDGRLNTQGAPAGELRARNHGALHDWRRPVHRRATSTPARGCSPAGTSSASARRATAGVLPVLLQRALSTIPARRRSAFRSTPTVRETIPARAASGGMQDGLDLHRRACAPPGDRAAAGAEVLVIFRQRDPARPTRRSSLASPPCIRQSDCHMSPVVRAVLTSREFDAPDSYFARYSWPVEFVARALKEVGYAGFPLNSALGPLVEHGPAVVRAARRRRMGARHGVVFDCRRCLRE